ncbi:hypothetical protein KY285_002854 [Solanum tuberosum]|nr:hypothetical protein KY285_002854 [Solanum tuberosum]
MQPEMKAALQLFQFSGGSTGDGDDNSNNQLRHLTLQRCLVRPPPVFRGLISLELSQITISTEDFGNFISRCLLLEHLVLDHSDNANNIEINAPKLRSFVFTGNLHFIHLKCVPLLAKISHESMESSVKARNYDLVAFFKSIEHLHWDYSNFRDQVKYQLRFPPLLNSLKRLYLSELCFDELVEVAWALCLLRSSPYLEELEIKGPGDLSGELIDYVPWWTVDEIPASFSDVTYNYLRTVKIKGVVGAGVDMQLIKVLLAKSPVLLRMVIDPYVEGDHSLEILAKITKY